MKNRYQLERLSLLLRTEIFCQTDGALEEYHAGTEFNPIRDNRLFREKLITLAKEQDVPLLYQDAWQTVCVCIHEGNRVFILAGPFALENMDDVELRRYYREYGMKSGSGRKIPVMTLSMIVAAVQMMAYGIFGKDFPEKELLEANHLAGEPDEAVEREQILFEIREDEKERYHHTYQEERRLLDCVREGKTEEAVRYSGEMDIGVGRLGRRDLTHWTNTVVAAVTLCVRAAIEGGLSPAEAYKISDFYIQKTEECHKVSELLDIRNRAVRDLAERVRRKRESGKHSSYIEQCMDYVSKHYKEKIYLKDMAESLGISSTYLSRIFSRETGMQLQDYINQFKVERAANLLVYSEEPIAYISSYVNFPSQSYFGKMFRKYKHMTPREYRERFKPAEFHAENE